MRRFYFSVDKRRGRPHVDFAVGNGKVVVAQAFQFGVFFFVFYWKKH